MQAVLYRNLQEPSRTLPSPSRFVISSNGKKVHRATPWTICVSFFFGKGQEQMHTLNFCNLYLILHELYCFQADLTLIISSQKQKLFIMQLYGQFVFPFFVNWQERNCALNLNKSNSSETLLTPSEYSKFLSSPSSLLKREQKLSIILLHGQFMFLFLKKMTRKKYALNFIRLYLVLQELYWLQADTANVFRPLHLW